MRFPPGWNGIPPVSIGNEAGGNGDAEVIDKSYIRQGDLTEINIIENIYYRKQAVIKNESCIHEGQYILKCRMLHFLKKHTDPPDI